MNNLHVIVALTDCASFSDLDLYEVMISGFSWYSNQFISALITILMLLTLFTSIILLMLQLPLSGFKSCAHYLNGPGSA